MEVSHRVSPKSSSSIEKGKLIGTYVCASPLETRCVECGRVHFLSTQTAGYRMARKDLSGQGLLTKRLRRGCKRSIDRDRSILIASLFQIIAFHSRSSENMNFAARALEQFDSRD